MFQSTFPIRYFQRFVTLGDDYSSTEYLKLLRCILTPLSASGSTLDQNQSDLPVTVSKFANMPLQKTPRHAHSRSFNVLVKPLSIARPTERQFSNATRSSFPDAVNKTYG